MYFDALVTVIEVQKNRERLGFPDKYHIVKFALESEGINSVQMNIWVHSNYPEEDIIKIARTFLNRRLLDFVELTGEDIYTADEVDSLWQTVKP